MHDFGSRPGGHARGVLDFTTIALATCVTLVVGCGGGSGPAQPKPPPTFTVAGTVTGGTGVDVALIGSTASATVAAAADGSFVFNGVPSGTYTITPTGADHAITPVQRRVVVDGANLSGVAFTATSLTTFDPLSAATLDGARWQSPEFVRTISNGKAFLSVRADGMQSNLVQGLSYTSALTVAAGNTRVTTFQAEVTAPAGGRVRTGAATAFGGLRLYYQPAATRNLSAPGALLRELVAALELYDGGSGLRVRRRFFHCDDASCATFSGSGITYVDPTGFTTTSEGVNATAPAVAGTPYTFTIAVNEATGVFTWTVQGGSFGSPGLTGTVDVATWASGAGLTLASTTDGFLSAQLFARTSDASEAGGGTGAFTATFDNVMIGTNGGAATLFDDFSTDLGEARWAPGANGAVQSAGGVLHLRTAASGTEAAPVAALATLAALTPGGVNAWEADVSLVDVQGVATAAAVQVGGVFLNDGTPGVAHDATGDIVSRVVLRVDGASALIARCVNGTCSAASTLATQPLPVSPARPLGVGTIHKVFQQWDPATSSFAFRIDDGTSLVVIPVSLTSPGPARAPSRYVRASVAFPAGTPAGRSAAVDVTVANVRTAR